jgi:hypothetical protein
MPKRAQLIAAIAIISLLPACAQSDDRRAVAAHIASLYVGADTTGDRDAIDSLRPDCDADPQSDTVQPVDKVTAGDPFPGNGRDTMVVVAIYHVLGTAHPEDPTLVGTQYWRFVAAPHEDTAILRMAAPANGGPMRIACGPFTSGHLALSQMAAALAALDSASHNSLSRAKHGESDSPAR